MDNEIHLLSCCLLDPKLITELLNKGVEAKWFKSPVNGKCFIGMFQRFNEGLPIDTVWLSDFMGLDYLKTLHNEFEAILLPQNECLSALDLIKKDYDYAEYLNFINDLKEESPDNPEMLIDKLLGYATTLKTIAKQPIDKATIKNAIIRELDGGIAVPSGYPQLDFMIKGIQPGVLIMVGGHTSHGKSIFALNIAQNIAEKKHKVTIFSTEMNENELIKRQAMMFSGVNPSIATSLTSEEKEMFAQAVDMAQALPITIFKTLSLATIKAQVYQGDSVLYIVDYIQMVQPDIEITNDVRRLGYIVRELEILTKEKNCCIIATSQFHRPPKDDAYRPDGFSYRGSGEIEENTDIGILMNYPYQTASFEQKDKLKEQGKENLLNIEVWKNRIHGLTGVIKMEFDRQSMRMKEVEK